MDTLLKYFDRAKLESIEFPFFDDRDNEVKVYVSYQKDDPLCLAGISIRRTKIANLEWVIKDEYFVDDFTVLFDAIREAVRLEERNDCEFVDF